MADSMFWHWKGPLAGQFVFAETEEDAAKMRSEGQQDCREFSMHQLLPVGTPPAKHDESNAWDERILGADENFVAVADDAMDAALDATLHVRRRPGRPRKEQ